MMAKYTFSKTRLAPDGYQLAAADYRRPDGRTILVSRAAAEARWGSWQVQYRKPRGDIAPYWYEWAIVEEGVVVRSGTQAISDVALWQGGDPYAGDRVGLSKAELVAAGFDAPEVWRIWSGDWYNQINPH